MILRLKCLGIFTPNELTCSVFSYLYFFLLIDSTHGSSIWNPSNRPIGMLKAVSWLNCLSITQATVVFAIKKTVVNILAG